jgi:REP element-mobilizing transposase RayT
MNKYNPNIHHRRSIRLKGYDYSQAGLYFITICCQDRAYLFGNIVNGEMKFNDIGKIANECWVDIPNHFPNSVLHEYVVMPNHVHGIIELKSNVGAAENFLSNNNKSNDDNGAVGNSVANDYSSLRSPSKTIGSIVRGFKIGVTKWMRQNTDVFDVWQRNYYEHIIRNEKSYNTISEYIINNPVKWTDDKFYIK